MHLFDLPWEYVIGQHILCHLTLKELFNFRRVCCDARQVAGIHWKQQRVLDLSKEEGFTIQAFLTVLEGCRALRKVNLKNSSWLTDESFIALVKNNTQLLELNLTNCTSMSSSCLQAIPGHCKQLKNLFLKGVTLAPHILSDICLRCSCTIERLDLTGCHFLDSTLLWEFVMKQQSLKWLAIADCRRVVDEDILWLIGSCASLEYLDVSGCGLRNRQRLIRSVLEKRKSLDHLVMTETILDEETQQLLKRDSLKVVFRPGLLTQVPQRNNLQAHHHHRAEIPLNFLL